MLLQPLGSKWLNVEALTHFARALGAARSGDPEAALPDVHHLGVLRDAIKQAKSDYWANEVEVMRLTSLAWSALAQQNSVEALDLMRAAADVVAACSEEAAAYTRRLARSARTVVVPMAP